ncbi:hypothetical protein [Gynurincola endophyticus]|uniref:hypothetical protein n=1 Tax=Gynurincola endophyticus TaxID=2479004 RepID=UPI000F8D155A|nr:hypothetical protein [Gynurincola endophyticus]
MRKVILFLSALFCTIFTYAETKTDSLQNIRHYKVTTYVRDISRGVTVSIDCGHEIARRVNRRLRDEGNQRMVFHSQAEVLNFFSKNGWNLHLYSEYIIKNSNATSYIFRKIVKPGEKCLNPDCGRDMY